MAENFRSLVDIYKKSCERYGNRQLFGTKQSGTWQWITYREFQSLVDRCRGGLATLGVGPGDRVAIVSNNRVEWAVAAYATYGLRAAYVPMYEDQKSEEWEFIINDCGAKVVIGSKAGIAEKLRGIRDRVATLQHVIGLELPSNDENSWDALLSRGAQNPVAPMDAEPSDACGYIYTSGTTGNPKGVILSHGNITSNVNAVHQILAIVDEERSLSFLPWAHSFGQTSELHTLFSAGCSLALNDDVNNLVANLAEVKPTVLFAVPRVFNRIYDGVNAQMREKPPAIQKLFKAGVENATKKNRGESLGLGGSLTLKLADKLIFSKIRERFGGRLKYALSGGAALNREVALFIDAMGIEVYEGYGLTETSPIATTNWPGSRKIGSVGRAIPGVTIKIDHEASGDAKQGEILVYGPNVMQGYHNRPEENAKAIMPDGGFRTGDLGYLDEDGFLFITGRIKEQYKLENGKYVAPVPLEDELKLSPFISNVMLYGANKPYNVVVVVPDMQALAKWADEKGVQLGDVSKNPQVQELIQQEIASYSKKFKGYEVPKKFLVVNEDFTTQNGMLTPKMSLKRRNVLERYQGQIDALYA